VIDLRSVCAPSLSLLYENDACYVLNKPSAIHSVSLPDDEKDTVAARLLALAPQLGKVGDKPSDAGLLQRLDFETSGVLLGAKSTEAWMSLREQLHAGLMSKYYVALVEGKFAAQRNINTYIGSPNRRATKVKVFGEKPRDKDRALPARSQFSLIHYFDQANVSLVRVQAHTARRHQVRAHASFAGHSLVGDALYGSTQSTESLAHLLSLATREAVPTFLLHAERIAFSDPQSNEKITVTAPGGDFLDALYRLGNISPGGETSSTS
jgi:23S rRNA pseudouridine1911/1915/1917 synthase